MKFITICTVNGHKYLTTVTADTNGGAEHKILDRSFTIGCRSVVTNVQAFTPKETNTQAFVDMADKAEMIGFEELIEVIDSADEDAAKADVIAEIDKKIETARIEKERVIQKYEMLDDELKRLIDMRRTLIRDW